MYAGGDNWKFVSAAGDRNFRALQYTGGNSNEVSRRHDHGEFQALFACDAIRRCAGIRRFVFRISTKLAAAAGAE
jgi:hypothetical protein